MNDRGVEWREHRLSRRSLIRGSTIAGLGAASYALVGCGDDDTQSGATATPTGAPSPAAASPSPTATGVTLGLQVPDSKISVRGELIAPRDADPAADLALEMHYVAPPAAKSRDRLFLFLPGAGPTPEFYRLIVDQGARNGFHAVGLNFHRTALPALCGDGGQCYEDSRLQMSDGQSRAASKVTVSRANSVDGRLVKLLAHLQSKRPSEGWGAYLDGANLRWGSTVVAGHSLGATQAALIARDRVVSRVAMMAGPIDHLPVGRVPNSQPVPWLLGAHATASDRYFSFGHAADEMIDWAVQWNGLKLGLNELGAVTNVDKLTSPYGSSHLLITEAPPGPGLASAQTGTPNHASVARDDYVPLDSAGQPKFAPVWQYMCFA